MSNTFNEVREWMYRNARNVELSLWRCLFEKGSKQDVLRALTFYVNEDGGFGHGLQPDSLAVDSSPIATAYALRVLKLAQCEEISHPLYQSIIRYLESGKHRQTYGWMYTVPENDNAPHASHLSYSEKNNTKEYYGITAELCTFIIGCCESHTELYETGIGLARTLIDIMEKKLPMGRTGIAAIIPLIDVMQKKKIEGYDYDELQKNVGEAIENILTYDKYAAEGVDIESLTSSTVPQNDYDEKKMKRVLKQKQSEDPASVKDDESYAENTTVKDLQDQAQEVSPALLGISPLHPSIFIRTPKSPFYEEYKDAIAEEMNTIKITRIRDDVWPLAHDWGKNTALYTRQFKVSENWWKGIVAIQNMLLMKTFGVEDL